VRVRTKSACFHGFVPGASVLRKTNHESSVDEIVWVQIQFAWVQTFTTGIWLPEASYSIIERIFELFLDPAGSVPVIDIVSIGRTLI